MAVASLVHSDTLYCVWQQITGNSCYSDTNIDNKQKLLSIVTLVTSFKLSELQVVHQKGICWPRISVASNYCSSVAFDQS